MTPHIPKAVLDLLAMYKAYVLLLGEVSEIENRYAKAKLLNIDSTDLANTRQQLTRKLQHVSDSMTFSDPLVWIQYKYYAYQDDAQPITTLHDFRIHCSKPGYICTKRFAFVNDALTKHGYPDLKNEKSYDDTLELSQLFNNDSLNQLIENDAFMNEWKQYEYHEIDGRVAKWQNFL